MKKKNALGYVPKSMKRKALKYAIKHPRKMAKMARKGYKAYKIYKKLPGFSAASSGKWHYRGTDLARSEETPDPMQLHGAIVANLALRPVVKYVNRKLFEPKPWFKRKPGLNEKPLNI